MSDVARLLHGLLDFKKASSFSSCPILVNTFQIKSIPFKVEKLVIMKL